MLKTDKNKHTRTNKHVRYFLALTLFLNTIRKFAKLIYRGKLIKDGAYYCYCAYILRIVRYSAFLWVVHTNTGIFLHGLKLYGESRTYQMILVSQKKKKLGVTMHFSEIIKLQFRKKSHTLLIFSRFLEILMFNYL